LHWEKERAKFIELFEQSRNSINLFCDKIVNYGKKISFDSMENILCSNGVDFNGEESEMVEQEFFLRLACDAIYVMKEEAHRDCTTTPIADGTRSLAPCLDPGLSNFLGKPCNCKQHLGLRLYF